jgi:HlyD family secretion protein
MKKSLRPIILIAILVIAGIFIWRWLANRNNGPKDKLFGNGTIEATEVDITSKVSGKILTLLVREGDNVRQGQLLATLDSDELAAQVTQAQGNLLAGQAALAELQAGTRSEDIRRAQAQYDASVQTGRQAQANYDLVLAGPRIEEIEQLRAGVRQAQVNLNDAETELRRYQVLVEQGAAPSQQVDQLTTRRNDAKAQLDAAQQRLAEAEAGSRKEQIRAAQAAQKQATAQERYSKAALDLALAGPRTETIAAAKARTEQAQGVLQAAEVQQGYTKIYAPSDGTVTLRNMEPGELVTPGTPIVRLAALESVWLKVYIPEPEMGRVKLGQSAQVTSDSYPDKQYSGRVIEISQEAEFTPKNVQTKEERVKQVFWVKIGVDNPDRELKPGMPADAEISVGMPSGS